MTLSVSFQHVLPLTVTSFIRERHMWKQALPVEIYTRIVSVWLPAALRHLGKAHNPKCVYSRSSLQ